MSKFANDEEIRYAHSLLLDGKPFFDQEKIDIIECDESRDVKACPGSGKTTTLLAKLVILANKMPLFNNQGVCVLTHTNVAIDEIKSKLGSKANVLFSYPNHFGTIQSFVDKFIAIPYYSQLFQTPIRWIDDDYASRVCRYEFNRKSFDEKKIFYREIADRVPKDAKGKEKEKLVNSLMFNKIFGTWVKITNPNNIFFRKHGDLQAFATNPNTGTYSLVDSIRLKGFREGILKYDDAYSLAYAYVSEVPEVKNIISQRFKYLFIDEMQDTDSKQLELVEQLFDSSKTTIQCFGDHHQSIFNSEDVDGNWLPNNPYPINLSIRFGEAIAKVLRTVCIEDNTQLSANPDVSSIKPIIIVYDNPQSVLPHFVNILSKQKIGDKSILDIAKRERDTDLLHRNNIKAIGWVGTDNPKVITLKSYFPAFNKNIRNKGKVNYDSFSSFIRRKENVTVKDYADSVLSAILRVLSFSETSKIEISGRKRNYTKTTFEDKFKQYGIDEYNDYRLKIAQWAKNIHDSEDHQYDATLAEIRSFINIKLSVIYSFDPNNTSIKSFLENTDCIANDIEMKANNIFIHDEVEIDISSIHSVKGETHAATLYLETSYRSKCESQRIADQLKGIVNSDNSEIHMQTLKMAYVGMSRPRYLLCMAISRDNFTFDCEELRRLWSIEDVVNDAEV